MTPLLRISIVVAVSALTFSLYNLINIWRKRRRLRVVLEVIRRQMHDAEFRGAVMPESTVTAFNEAAASLRLRLYKE